ncbi:TetR/AcrR family transcriptional regulator [Chitinophaga pinensis]|uniref:Transcriptional regulator, TetR family n=1 Tax=Chitinophaga pinensis (strain ATCC 43595 / DSM 2588 / LMG 13176 / NBRC 15968 / NCIMB 11800 / UQM 2034) TaxID=485918 RepID=A0A979GXB8_CHIPD|nr:TetR/AcrR family transcriptional regulator [Chitinophaga pinensis]ACU64548.1 transcriptional regulator, TetR family [Chitinophaga pinensis DSM 2588]
MSKETLQPRERILDTAYRLFLGQGYNSTGINQIIEEADVAKASFYQHFKSKEDLCVGVLEKRHQYIEEQAQALSAQKRSAKMKVLASFDLIALLNEKESFRGCAFLNILSEIPADNVKVRDVIHDHKSNIRQNFRNLLDNAELADHVYLLYEGAFVESQLYRDQWPVNRAKKIVNSLIN